MRERVVKNRPKLILAPLVVGAALAFASAAYACVAITGSITTTYNGATCQNTPATCKVNPGVVIASSGSQLATPDGTYWSLYFLNYKSLQGGTRTCMGAWGDIEQKIAGPVRQSSSTVGPLSAQIPLTALQSSSTTTPQGPALVCWIDSDLSGIPYYNHATPPTELEVIGGFDPPPVPGPGFPRCNQPADDGKTHDDPSTGLRWQCKQVGGGVFTWRPVGPYR